MSFRLMVQFVSPFSDASAINLSMTPLLESKGNYKKKTHTHTHYNNNKNNLFF
ncbi:hypothetical protein Hanom_Chr00s000004g01610311 [Helianthus anomalus]